MYAFAIVWGFVFKPITFIKILAYEESFVSIYYSLSLYFRLSFAVMYMLGYVNHVENSDFDQIAFGLQSEHMPIGENLVLNGQKHSIII